MTLIWIAAAWLLLPVPLAVFVGRAFARSGGPGGIHAGGAGVDASTSGVGPNADLLTGDRARAGTG